MRKIIEPPTLTAQFSDVADTLVITIGVKRNDGLHITDGQKDAAMNAAKSVLQIIGAEVEANSTAILCPVDLPEGSNVYVSAAVELFTDDETEPVGEQEPEPEPETTDAPSLDDKNEQDTEEESEPDGELGETEPETDEETIIETEDDAE